MRHVIAIFVILGGVFFLLFRSRMVDVAEGSRRNLFGERGSRFDRAWDRVILTVVPLLLIAAGIATLLGWGG